MKDGELSLPPTLGAPLIAAYGLKKTYQQRRWFSRQQLLIKSLDQVSLVIHRGSTLALVGESGSGKSTLARCLALLEEPNEGEIWFEGRNVLALPKSQARRTRQQIQLIFQDSSTALNPRLKALDIVAEPLAIQRQGTRRQRSSRTLQLMQEVGLASQWRNRLPFELSGGQRQRLVLARALAAQPKLLILDEAFSGLDLPLRAQVVDLLVDVKERWALTYLVISHDLGLVGGIADEIAVLHQGRVVEQGSVKALLSSPKHPYTRAMVAASLAVQPQCAGA